MAKSIAKYFIAVVPTGELQVRATELKIALKDQFYIKYALKSPAHVTLKMPFNWNEKKEEKLTLKLSAFFSRFAAFQLEFRGFGRFGKRVIYIKVNESPELGILQKDLSQFCKQELKLIKELSDNAFTPHMTIAFKDLKEKNFATYWDFLKSKKISQRINVDEIALLKRIDGRWEVIQTFALGMINR